jgi:hypothetical protein
MKMNNLNNEHIPLGKCTVQMKYSYRNIHTILYYLLLVGSNKKTLNKTCKLLTQININPAKFLLLG